MEQLEVEIFHYFATLENEFEGEKVNFFRSRIISDLKLLSLVISLPAFPSFPNIRATPERIVEATPERNVEATAISTLTIAPTPEAVSGDYVAKPPTILKFSNTLR